MAKRMGGGIPKAPGPVVGENRFPVHHSDFVRDAAFQQCVAEAQARRARTKNDIAFRGQNKPLLSK